jgi:tripartite-type tricarboxylate transporter receptor subunit TctC
MSNTKRVAAGIRRLVPALSLSLVSGVCAAQSNSGQIDLDRPITYIVAFGPGGGSDQVARASAAVLEEALGIQLPVVNVPGATGNTGMTNLVSTTPGQAMAILIQDTLATVPLGTSSFQLDEIQGVCRLQTMPSALLVKTGTYENWEDLAKAAKANPNTIKVATVGRNSIDSLMLGALGEEQGTEFRKVPFANPSERYISLLGGAVDALYEQLGDVRPYLDSGEYTPVVIFSKDPVEGFEDATYATDLGVAEDSILAQFRGIVMHADTDPAIVQAVSDACSQTTENAKFQEFQKAVFASDESYMPADEFEAYIDQQAKVIENLMQQYLPGE